MSYDFCNLNLITSSPFITAKYSKKSKRFPGLLKILFIVLLVVAILVLLGLAYCLKIKRTKGNCIVSITFYSSNLFTFHKFNNKIAE